MPTADVNLYFKVKGDLESALNRINVALGGTEKVAQKSSKTLGASFKAWAKPLQDTIIMFRRIGIYAGIAIAPLALAMNDLNNKLDKASDVASKLRISLSDASKQMYGFDIASKESKDGQTALNKTWQTASNVISGFGNNLAIAYGWLTKFATVAIGKQLGATDEQIRKAVRHVTTPNQMSDANAPLLAQMKTEMDKAELTSMTFQRRQIDAQAQRYLDKGISSATVNDWRKTQFIPIEEEKTKELLKQQAIRLKVESQTLGAMEKEQQAALLDFTDKFGDDGDLVKAFIAGQKALFESAQKTAMGITQFWDNTGKGLEDTFTSMFSDSFRGELHSFQEYFKNFALSLADAFSAMIAKMAKNMIVFGNLVGESGGGNTYGGLAGIISGGIMSLFGGGGVQAGGKTQSQILGINTGAYRHSGGMVTRAHSGLAIDEVPIIAQTGEGILSRRAMRSLGRGNFDRLNNGDTRGMGGGGGVNITISPVIMAWDYTDVYRNRKQLTDAVVQDILNNGDIRKVIQGVR